MTLTNEYCVKTVAVDLATAVLNVPCGFPECLPWCSFRESTILVSPILTASHSDTNVASLTCMLQQSSVLLHLPFLHHFPPPVRRALPRPGLLGLACVLVSELSAAVFEPCPAASEPVETSAVSAS